jgi:uncharacterized protein (TIGR00251 family)
VTSPLDASGGRLRLAVRLQPGAGRNEAGGVELDAAGKAFLRVRVTEPPEGGKANRALIKLLAKAWRIPASSLEVIAGARDRRKVLEIDGGPEVAQRIQHWLGTGT